MASKARPPAGVPSRADQIVEYVRFHELGGGCAVVDAVMATCRRDDGIHADDLPGFAAVSRLVRAGRLIRTPAPAGFGPSRDRLTTPLPTNPDFTGVAQ